MRPRAKAISHLLFAFAVSCAPLAASAEESLEWVTVPNGVSEIEVPAFLVEGPAKALFEDGVDIGTSYDAEGSSLGLKSYWAGSNERPYVYLTENVAGTSSSITYSVDEDALGVISGFEDGQSTIYYAMCRKLDERNRCIVMDYAATERAFLDPIVDRIAKSFRK